MCTIAVEIRHKASGRIEAMSTMGNASTSAHLQFERDIRRNHKIRLPKRPLPNRCLHAKMQSCGGTPNASGFASGSVRSGLRAPCFLLQCSSRGGKAETERQKVEDTTRRSQLKLGIVSGTGRAA